jgi:hypothetical protein
VERWVIKGSAFNPDDSETFENISNSSVGTLAERSHRGEEAADFWPLVEVGFGIAGCAQP